MDTNLHQEKLPNAPLQEVVFELLWELGSDEQGFPHDEDFDFAQGVFADLTKDKFPLRKKTPFNNVPFRAYPVPVHQFWKAENVWPVLQIGHGLLVVNDVEANYTWKNYKKLIHEVIKLLMKAYQKELTFKTIKLKYIDAYETGDENRIDFINKHFNLNLVNNFIDNDSPENINLSQTFKLENADFLETILSTGYSPANKPAIIWQSTVYREDKLTKDQLFAWLDNAHETASRHFKKFVTKDFYAKFAEKK
jgi:uncharacterized protein (TIGR04255 family)